jgi:hypothetical protein
LVGCPLHSAIQPLTNQAINSLFVIYTIPYKSSNTKFQFVFFASRGRSGLMVLKVLTLQQKDGYMNTSMTTIYYLYIIYSIDFCI